jgi:putative transposase
MAAQRREMVQEVRATHGYSEHRACRLFSLSRSVCRYQPKQHDDEPTQTVLTGVVEQHPRWGFRKMVQRLRHLGHGWNHKRVYRVYCQLRLNLHIKPKKRLLAHDPQPLTRPLAPDRSWSVDFMIDSLGSGRTFSTLNVINDFNLEALWIEVDISLPGGISENYVFQSISAVSIGLTIFFGFLHASHVYYSSNIRIIVFKKFI